MYFVQFLGDGVKQRVQGFEMYSRLCSVGSLCIGAGTPVLVSFVLDLICIIPLDLMHFARVDP